MRLARFLQRVERVGKCLNHLDVDAVYFENPVDLYYLTGLKLSSGRLVVHPRGSRLFVDGRYFQIAQENSPVPSSLESVEAFTSFLKEAGVSRIAFDGAHTPFRRYVQLKSSTGCEWVSADSLFERLRLIKDPEEIALMKKSAALAWKGHEWIVSSLRVGITERELARGFEIFCLENGADKLSFEPIIAFGKNSAMPHYHPQDTRLQSGDEVLIDIGVVLDSYHSDMTRVHFFETQSHEMHSFYEIAKRAFTEALKLCRPQQTFGALDLAARAVMREANVEELFVHGLGHGIGLLTHEFPRIKYTSDSKDVKLEPGMVFTIEPGLYVPGRGGVRYEDTVAITEEGCENFYG